MVRYCIAKGCNVKEKQGLILFRFPKERERRAKWISLVNRSDWQPHVNSTLCEIHFGKDQWEQRRVDGSRKLQCSAIPSLLSSGENSLPASYITFLYEHNYCRLPSAPAAKISASEIQSLASSPITDTTDEEYVEASSAPAAKISASETQSLAFSPITDATEEESVEASSAPAGKISASETQLLASSPIADTTEEESVETSSAPAVKISASETQSLAFSPVTDITEEESVEALKRRLQLKEKELTALQTKHVSTQKMASRVFNSYRSMKRRHETIKTKLKRLEDFHYRSHGLFAVRLRQNQLKALYSKITRGRKWSILTNLL